MLFEAVVLAKRELLPTAVLPVPVLFVKEKAPNAVLFEAVVLASNAT